MFGCICPNTEGKKRCEKIFSMVNHNPCVDYSPSSASFDLSGTDSALYPFEPHEDTNFQEILLHPTNMYPHFLYPGTAGPGQSSAYYELDRDVASNLEEQQLRYFQHGDLDQSAGMPKIFLYPHSVPPDLQDSSSAIRVFENNRWETQWMHVRTNPRQFRPPTPSSPTSYRSYFSSTSTSSSSSITSSTSMPSVFLSTTWYPPKHDRESSTSTATNTEHKSQHADGYDDGHRHRHHHHHNNQHQNQHHNQHNQHNQHVRDRDPSARPGAPPEPPALALPPASSTPTTIDERTYDQHRYGAGLVGVAGRRKFAPRPTYEHGAAYERVDEELDGLDEFRSAHLPVDRLFDLREAFDGFIDSVNVISNSDNTTIESQVENPLIDADHQDLHDLKQLPIPNVHYHRVHQKQKNQSYEDHEVGLAAPSSLPDNERIAQQPMKVILSSTCHHAYSACKNDPDCKGLLQPVLSNCDHSSCARNECISSLQHFYKMANHKHSMEIAFCLCRKSEGKRDECMLAQEKMHPFCAQRVPNGVETPTCDSLAEACREDPACRSKLEHYEQNCAVDSLTKKCAGPAQGCRTAMLGILGTVLRSNCACKKTDSTPPYKCLGWQRLLWVNSCVVEAQKDFHARRNKHHNHGRTTQQSSSGQPTSPTLTRWPSVGTPRASLVAATSLGLAESEDNEENETGQEGDDEDGEQQQQQQQQQQRQLENNVIPDVTIRQTVETTAEILTTPSTTSSTTLSTTTTTTTTTMAPTTPSTTTTSTPPPRFCVVQRPSQSHQYIREGKGKRLYREDEPECSELCQCGAGERLTCNTICVESSPCKTDFAFYNHAAPAYQAYRGRCLCYSGRFICMRPAPEAYNIPHGVFMFLGYSETDENLLKPHNNLTVVDAVSSLDNFMREEVNNQTICTLFLYNVTKENVIAVARLMTDNTSTNNVTQAQSLQHLLRIKEECASMLQDLSDKINNRHQEVHSHPLLSIFKMAEVEIKLPRASGVSAQLLSSEPCRGLLFAGLTALLSLVVGIS